MLVWFMSRNVLVHADLVGENGLIVKKFMKWSLMSAIIVPVVILEILSALVKIWSI